MTSGSRASKLGAGRRVSTLCGQTGRRSENRAREHAEVEVFIVRGISEARAADDVETSHGLGKRTLALPSPSRRWGPRRSHSAEPTNLKGVVVMAGVLGGGVEVLTLGSRLGFCTSTADDGRGVTCVESWAAPTPSRIGPSAAWLAVLSRDSAGKSPMSFPQHHPSISLSLSDLCTRPYRIASRRITDGLLHLRDQESSLDFRPFSEAKCPPSASAS